MEISDFLNYDYHCLFMISRCIFFIGFYRDGSRIISYCFVINARIGIITRIKTKKLMNIST